MTNRSDALFSLSVALLLGPITGLSQPQWQYAGLQGESIKAIAISPADPNVIYVGSKSNFSSGAPGGLFRTTTGGATWDTLLRGLSVADIDIDPTQPQILYVCALFLGVLKSYDAGQNWGRADSGITIGQEVGPVALAINPGQPEVVYCGTAGFFGGTSYKSTTGGNSWIQLGCPPVPPYPPCSLLANGAISIGVDPQRPETLFVGVPSLSSLLKTSDGGMDWDTTVHLDWGLPYAIVFDPFDEQKIYVGRSNTGLHMSTDGGMTWSKITGGLPDTTHLVSIAVNNQRRNELYAMTAGIYSRRDIFHSSDGGITWAYTNIPVNTSDGAVAVSPTGSKVFAGVQQGVYKMDIDDGVKASNPLGIANFSLDDVYPNPVNGTATVSYRVPRGGTVSLKLYDILGREICTLLNEYRQPGQYRVRLDVSGLSTGMYLLRANTGSVQLTTKFVVVK